MLIRVYNKLLKLSLDASIREIIRFLDTRLSDYLTFGFALGVDVNKLVQMKSMNSPLNGDTKGCIEHIFHLWKTNSNNASYQPILDALKASGYGYFSDIIEKYYEFPRQVNLSTFELTNEGDKINSMLNKINYA